MHSRDCHGGIGTGEKRAFRLHALLESNSVTMLAGCYQQVHTHIRADGEGTTYFEGKKKKI